jgi:hypothetical protein
MARWFLLVVALAFVGCRTAPVHREAPSAPHTHEEHAHEGHAHAARGHEGHAHGLERPPPLRLDLCRDWFACAQDAHASRCGTPYVHAFWLEPSFLGRDLLFSVGTEGDDHVAEPELEWALTRRLLLVAELPYALTEDGDDGLGDLELGLRGLLVESNRLLVSGQVAFEVPTAKDGLGADEVVVAPSVLAWADLGSWFTLQGGATFEFATATEETTFTWGAALIKSFRASPLFGACGGSHGHDSVLSLFLEASGTTPLSGSDDASEHELLFGLSAPVTHGLDARAAWTLLWDDEREAESGWVLGFAWHL